MFRHVPLSSVSGKSDDAFPLKVYEKAHVVPPFPNTPTWPKGSWIREKREKTYAETEHEIFEKKGFVTMTSFLTEEALAFLRAQVDHVWRFKHPSVQKSWLMNLHEILPQDRNWIWKLATEPAIVDIVRHHLGKHFVFNSAQILVKPPMSEDSKGGRIIPWHQDGQIIRTFWICLDDVDEENGTLILKPGWHTLGSMKVKKIENQSDYLEGKPQFSMKDGEISLSVTKPRVPLNVIDVDHYCEGGLEEFEKDIVQYRLRAGDAAMHHPSLPHMSMPNRSRSRWRRILILRYLPAKFPKPRGKFHQHVFTAKLFEKNSYLVSGRDVAKQGLLKAPVCSSTPDAAGPPSSSRGERGGDSEGGVVREI
eukprot:g1325.t1